MNPGILYIVPTPIGNLSDVTSRALDTLRSVDLIACEDTRHTMKLLVTYSITKPLISFYSQNQWRRIPEIIEALTQGKNVAVVSDGGTPTISDPGAQLVQRAVEEQLPVVALPGPSAVITALSASGLPTNGFVFLGFLKLKPGKMRSEVTQALGLGKTVVFYESPHRIHRTFETLSTVVPAPTQTVIARELTKTYEEYIRGSFQQVHTAIASRELKGEITVLLSPEKDHHSESEEEHP